MIEGNYIILLLLILLSAFFSFAETALLSVSQMKIRSYLADGRSGAQALHRLRSNPQRMIVTILLSSNIVNFSAAALVTLITENKLGSGGIGVGIGLITLIILVFGEITPKSLASSYAGRIALLVAEPIEILSIILYPVVILLVSFNAVIHKTLRARPDRSLTEADLKSAIELGLEKQLIEPQEEMIILRALKLHDISAYEIMTPKQKIFSLSASHRIVDVIGEFGKIGYSRIPIFEGNKNFIVGVVNTKDVLLAVSQNKPEQTLRELSIDPIFISEETKIDNLLRTFQRNQTHMMFVVNPNKELVGLVSLEDILGEIVGEITDEKEIVPGTIIRIDKNTIISHGDTYIEKINRFFNADLPLGYATLSQLIYAQKVKVQKNNSFNIDGVKITIVQIYKNTLRKVRLEKIPLVS